MVYQTVFTILINNHFCSKTYLYYIMQDQHAKKKLRIESEIWKEKLAGGSGYVFAESEALS